MTQVPRKKIIITQVGHKKSCNGQRLKTNVTFWNMSSCPPLYSFIAIFCKKNAHNRRGTVFAACRLVQIQKIAPSCDPTCLLPLPVENTCVKRGGQKTRPIMKMMINTMVGMKTIMRTHAMMRMRMRTWRQKHGGLRCLAELVKQPACQISSLYLAEDFCFSKYLPNMMQGFQIFFKYEEPPSPSQNDFDCQNILKYDNARYPNISLSQMYSLYSWFPRKDSSLLLKTMSLCQ